MVSEGGRSLLERDTVLASVTDRLLRIPLEIHADSIFMSQRPDVKNERGCRRTAVEPRGATYSVHQNLHFKGASRRTLLQVFGNDRRQGQGRQPILRISQLGDLPPSELLEHSRFSRVRHPRLKALDANDRVPLRLTDAPSVPVEGVLPSPDRLQPCFTH